MCFVGRIGEVGSEDSAFTPFVKSTVRAMCAPRISRFFSLRWSVVVSVDPLSSTLHAHKCALHYDVLQGLVGRGTSHLSGTPIDVPAISC